MLTLEQPIYERNLRPEGGKQQESHQINGEVEEEGMRVPTRSVSERLSEHGSTGGKGGFGGFRNDRLGQPHENLGSSESTGVLYTV